MKFPVKLVEKEEGGFDLVDDENKIIIANVDPALGSKIVVPINNFGAAYNLVKELSNGDSEKAKSEARGFIEYIGSYA